MPSLGRTVLVGLAVLAATLALSPWLLPLYQGGVRFTAQTFLPVVVPGLDVGPDGAQGWRVFRGQADGTESDILGISAKSLTQLYAGVILLPPLLAMSPLPWPRRLRLMGWGVLLLLLLQGGMLVLFLLAWTHYQRTRPDSDLYTWLTLLHSTAGQWAVIPVWAGLTWGHWFRVRPA